MRANDERIRAAAIAEITAVGWDEATLTGIAKRAGLSVGALYSRAETKSELGNIVWSATVRDWLRSALANILETAHMGHVQALGQAYSALEDETLLLSAALEFLIASLFDDELDEVVGADIREMVNDLRQYPIESGGEGVSPPQQAANLLTLVFAFGRMMAKRSNPGMEPIHPSQCAATVAMTKSDHTGEGLSAAPEVAFLRDVGDLDPDLAVITEAVINVIGTVGYRRATIARMGRAAGRSGGSLFARFQDKAHVVSYSAHARLFTPLELWENYQVVEAEYGPHLSRAMWVANVLQPANKRYWTVHLELARVAQFINELAAFRPSTTPHLYANLGVMLVGAFSDDIHGLPFDGPFAAGYAT